MASITIRNFSDGAKDALRVHAAKAGVSLEAYARQILQEAARSDSQGKQSNLLDLSRELFSEDGIDLDLPSRSSTRDVDLFS